MELLKREVTIVMVTVREIYEALQKRIKEAQNKDSRDVFTMSLLYYLINNENAHKESYIIETIQKQLKKYKIYDLIDLEKAFDNDKVAYVDVIIMLNNNKIYEYKAIQIEEVITRLPF